MDSQKQAYKIEAYDLLNELEASLLELEAAPHDMDLVDRVFRAMHTIKGSGAMFGFEAVAEFTHDVETAFDLVRGGRMAVSTHLVNLALRARDHIKGLLDDDEDPARIASDEGRALITGFRSMLSGDDSTPPHDHARVVFHPADDAAACAGTDTIFRIRFAPRPSLFQNGTNPLALLEEIAGLGDCNIIAHTDRMPDTEAFDPESCYLYWDILLTASCDRDAIQDVFIFVEDDCELSIDLIDTLDALVEDPQYKQIGRILIERGELNPDDLSHALEKQRPLGEILVEEQAVSREKVQAALAEQQFVRTAGSCRGSQTKTTSLRVAAEKLDELVNLVGELVTVQARLHQKASLEQDPELMAISEVVERLTAELRDNTLSIRMVPIDATFSKLRRLVRDLSGDLGKQIALQTIGGDTELDKTVIEQLTDPLVHILRNSIDHGIESPDRRRGAGKPEKGTIRLKAEHAGANVLIHIQDDGCGIDLEHIRRKAVAKGLVPPDAERSDKEWLQMIFHPGFSTADAVTNVSGRGVGMDVVKRRIEELRGSIDVHSQKGRGTTITLKLPLTLAIIDGLLVEIDDNKFVLPLSTIEVCVELTRDDLAKTKARNILNIRDQIVPFVPLRAHFGIESPPPAIEQVVINEVDGQRVGIVVDRVIGEHQIVIKTMSALYKDVPEVSGATILGDGTVALILDVQRMLKEQDAQPAHKAA